LPTDREPSRYKFAARAARWCAAHRRRWRGVWLGRILALSVLVAALTVPAAADAVAPLSSSNGSRFSSTPIPAGALRQIAAKHGQFAYVPASVPVGFTFASWRSERPSHANLLKRLHLTFARGRTLMVWTVSDGRDADDYADCPSRHYGSKRLIGGRSVYYAHGNHGDSAWTCFNAPLREGGRKPLGIDLWIANDPGRPSPLSAMRIVAGARLAHSPAAPAPVAGPLPATTTTTSAPTTTTTAPPPPTPPPVPAAGNCAPSYPDVCIPPPPPDLDCKDVSYRRFLVIYNVPSPDPHRFDGDHDGVGCET
jgi:hypothetical protein